MLITKFIFHHHQRLSNIMVLFCVVEHRQKAILCSSFFVAAVAAATTAATIVDATVELICIIPQLPVPLSGHTVCRCCWCHDAADRGVCRTCPTFDFISVDSWARSGSWSSAPQPIKRSIFHKPFGSCLARKWKKWAVVVEEVLKDVDLLSKALCVLECKWSEFLETFLGIFFIVARAMWEFLRMHTEAVILLGISFGFLVYSYSEVEGVRA